MRIDRYALFSGNRVSTVARGAELASAIEWKPGFHSVVGAEQLDQFGESCRVEGVLQSLC